ncbi:MAG: AAA family ATPase [Nitrospinales bacterium]
MKSTQEALQRLKRNIESVIIGKPDTIELLIITLLARGHLMIEDVPGVGKTSMAYALAHSLNLSFKRIQFTNDILPADITGVTVYNQKDNDFKFVQGPLFSNLVLADEINRCTPRTQSALLEAMNEHQVSVDHQTYSLEQPFMVIATQNPVESHGTFPLPESQMDRFMMYISMGYPSLQDERRLLALNPIKAELHSLNPVLSKNDLLQMQKQVDEVRIEPVLADYLLNIITRSRKTKHLALGVSPRGGLIFQQAARARALFHGRNYCIPDDIKELAIPVLCHRVIPDSKHISHDRRVADTSAIITEIIEAEEVPV